MMKVPEHSSCIIVGSARNVETQIEKTFEVLSKSFADFQTLEFLIIESFSTDNTLSRLNDLQNRFTNFTFESTTNLDFYLQKRTERIASARNHALRMIRNSPQAYDYVVVADLDGVNKNLSKDSVRTCWNYSNWDAMFANQTGFYYDLWALRHPILCPGDCWQDFKELKVLLGKKSAYKFALTNRMFRLISEQPIKVMSAFGGLGIYTAEAYLSGHYIGMQNGEETCEHVYFNQSLNESGYNLYINPKLLNLRGVKRSLKAFQIRHLNVKQPS